MQSKPIRPPARRKIRRLVGGLNDVQPKLRRKIIRLITWNCSRGKYDEKRSNILSLNPDLAVFQEASQTKTLRCNDFWYGKHHTNGLAILTQKGIKATIGPIDKKAPWSIVPIVVSGKFSFNLLAVWTRAEEKYIQSLDKALDDYSGFLKKAPSAVIGDFNSNAIWDNPKKSTDFSRVAKRLFNEFGLQSAYHVFQNEQYGEESCPTDQFRWHKDDALHIDY
ncbi:MAG: endonuclease/exonuclease/phosphatase family protein [Planctomycetes bacterium]|nr:endonuclease/exonuclease/phosphatase family protein [Planctomycetota bacterium]